MERWRLRVKGVLGDSGYVDGQCLGYSLGYSFDIGMVSKLDFICDELYSQSVFTYSVKVKYEGSWLFK